MSAMPDRSATVRAYYQQHPEWFTAERHDENRRRSLPFLIENLHANHPEDRGKWGVLVKTDRNNKIPCDVLVWLDDQNHVDVCDATGGIWGVHGNIAINGGGRWTWAPADVVDPSGEERALRPPPYDVPNIPPPPGEPDTPVPQPTPVDLGPVLAALADLRGIVEQLRDKPPASVDVKFPNYSGEATSGPKWARVTTRVHLTPEGQ